VETGEDGDEFLSRAAFRHRLGGLQRQVPSACLLYVGLCVYDFLRRNNNNNNKQTFQNVQLTD